MAIRRSVVRASIVVIPACGGAGFAGVEPASAKQADSPPREWSDVADSFASAGCNSEESTVLI